MPEDGFPERARQEVERILPAMVKRVATRKPSQIPALAATKEDSPKLLCLDQNKWIELARAHFGNGEPHAVRALRILRNAVQEERLVIPVLTSNLMEAGEHSDASRRERLAQFMVELSGNTSIVDNRRIRRTELRDAVSRAFLQVETESFRPQLLRRGMAAAAGVEKVIRTGQGGLDNLVNDALLEPEVQALLLAHAIDRDTNGRLREIDALGMARIARIRTLDAELPLAERRRRELKNLLHEGGIADVLRHVVRDAGVDADDFNVWLEENKNYLDLAAEVPSIQVQAELMLVRDRNPDAPTQPNDAKDLSFLQVAIPYANFVVTENLWAHLARACGLDRKYDTVVLAKLKDLADVIEGNR